MKIWKWAERILCVCVLAVFALAVYFAVRGIPMSHMPNPKYVVSVRVSYTQVGDAPNGMDYTDTEHIRRACTLARQLQYEPQFGCKCWAEPEFCMTFQLDDGTTDVIGACDGFIYRNGSIRHFRHYDTFIDSAVSLFDLQELE